jgi:hypothetical protein
MLDDAITNLTKGEVFAKRGEWAKSYAFYSKSLNAYNQISKTNFDIAQPMIEECKAQMQRLSTYVKNERIRDQRESASRSDSASRLCRSHIRGQSQNHGRMKILRPRPSRSIPESTISNILSCYENVSSVAPPLLDESFYIVKSADYTIEKMQKLIAEKNRQIEELKKSYSVEFKQLKKAMEQLTQNDALIFRDEMINKYTALKKHLKDLNAD